MNFFTSIAQSLYSVDFYKRLIREPLTRGLLYLTCWSVLVCALFALFLGVRLYPEAHTFFNWLGDSIPPIEWTPEGLRMSQKSPYELKHPKYGHVATLHLDKKEITDEERGEALFYVTATKLYVQGNERQGKRVYDLVSKEDVKVKRANFVVDGTFIQKVEKKIKPIVTATLLICVLLIFFIWKLLAALFYSLIGMLINLFRREKLSYESVLNVTFFAMTGSVLVQLILIALDDVIKIKFGFLGSLILTATYLYLGIKFTEETLPPSSYEFETP